MLWRSFIISVHWVASVHRWRPIVKWTDWSLPVWRAMCLARWTGCVPSSFLRYNSHVNITGERLRLMREQQGLSIRAVARQEQISPSYLSGLERGENAPNVWPLLARLARRYGTTTDYLLGLTDDPRPVERAGRVLQEGGVPYQTFTDAERTLLAHFRRLPEDLQNSLLQFVEALAQQTGQVAPTTDESVAGREEDPGVKP